MWLLVFHFSAVVHICQYIICFSSFVVISDLQCLKYHTYAKHSPSALDITILQPQLVSNLIKCTQTTTNRIKARLPYSATTELPNSHIYTHTRTHLARSFANSSVRVWACCKALKMREWRTGLARHKNKIIKISSPLTTSRLTPAVCGMWHVAYTAVVWLLWKLAYGKQCCWQVRLNVAATFEISGYKKFHNQNVYRYVCVCNGA